MSINLNSTLYESLAEPLEMATRGLYYGDGLFETIRVFKGRIPFIDLHWERLEAGMRLLGFDMPANWSAEFFSKEIERVVQGNARVRLSVWRSVGGLFFPTDNHPNFLITATALNTDVFTWQHTGLQVRLSEKVCLPVDALSGYKTLGGTRYVVAAMEARAMGVDDVIVLNQRGQIGEASSSNVLWIKGETLYAPSPSDGQVTGTFQKILFDILRTEGITVVEKPSTFAELLAADEVFLTNAIQGIRWVQFLEGVEFNCSKSAYFNNLVVKHLERILP